MSLIKQEFKLREKISESDFEAVEDARRKLFEVDSCPLVLSDESPDDIDLVKNISHKILSSFKNIIIIGTGASESIPKALFDLGNTELNVVFLSNVDSYCVKKSLEGLDKKSTCVLSISKSGRTIETIVLTKYIKNWFDDSNGDLASRFFFITEDVDSPLLEIARTMDATIVRHSSIGGRFAFFTSLGFLSALIAGFDIDEIISGVHDVFPELIKSRSWVMDGAAYNLAMNRKFSNNVFMHYGDRFEGLNLWCRQLVAESLGKNSKGINHISSRGIVDHHSQLQLYLDGPKDKFFTVLFEEKKGSDEFTRIFEKQRISALKAIENKNRNIRLISTIEVSEKFIAEFFMATMLEVIIFAYVKNIDPFGQPAVEEIKKEAII